MLGPLFYDLPLGAGIVVGVVVGVVVGFVVAAVVGTAESNNNNRYNFLLAVHDI